MPQVQQGQRVLHLQLQARQELKVQRDPQVHKVSQGQQVQLVLPLQSLDLQVPQELKVLLDLQDLRVPLVQQVPHLL